MSVFVSYSSADLEFTRALVNEIEARGFDVWWDQDDMAGGDAWRGQLADAIRGCHAFVLVLSPNSMSSRNVINEVTAALENERRVFPIVHQPCRLHRDIEIDIAGIHRIDCATQPFSDGVARLLASLGGVVTPQAEERVGSDAGSAPVPEHVAVDPDEAINRGVLLMDQGRAQEAEAAFRSAIASGHADLGLEAAVNLGFVLGRENRPEEAEEVYRAVMARGHANFSPAAAFNLGVLLQAQGRDREAEEAYRSAIASEHKDEAPMAMVNLGYMLAEQDRFQEAEEAYRGAIASGHADQAPKAAEGLRRLKEGG